MLEDDDAGVSQLAGSEHSIEERDWRRLSLTEPHLVPWLPSNFPIHFLQRKQLRPQLPLGLPALVATARQNRTSGSKRRIVTEVGSGGLE